MPNTHTTEVEHEAPEREGYDYRLMLDGSADLALLALHDYVPFCHDAESSTFPSFSSAVSAAQGLRNAMADVAKITVEIYHEGVIR